ncbi:ATP-grasp domain-containing protein [Kitasatospora sp. NPDC002227]|uniref:ATP-grasp domain-containing protein n=1 Tax=Kitasatospora sp. NPDC002227 TaxID=3154773 RepID=UPI00332EA7DE
MGDNSAPARPAAFILTGSFLAICRAPRYLQELSRRGLKVLLITGSSWREQAVAGMADQGHPASVIEDIAFVEGSVDREGSFNSGVVAAANAWRERYDIVGIYAAGETLVEPTGIVADALGLPAPGLRASRACRSKYLQRFYLPEFSPAASVIPAGEREAFDAAAVSYPAVIKPATRHSSSGVETVEEAGKLRELLMAYPDHETILVEQKIVGQEYSVESLVQHGKTVFASVIRKETTDAHATTFVELAHTVSGEPSQERTTLLDANQAMLDALDFQDGMTHSEWRLDADGRPYLMEVAARTPGDGITVLYHLATGRALEPEIIKIALGEPAEYPTPTRLARQVYLEHTPGVLEEVTIDWPGITPQWAGEGDLWPEVPVGEAGDPPTLRAMFVQKETGRELGPLLSSEDRVGNFVIDAPTAAELDELEQRVRAAVTVRTRPVDQG